MTAAPEPNAAPVFRWRGLDAEGHPKTGELRAPTVRHARALLRRQGISAKGVRRVRRRVAGKRVTAGEVALFSRQMATLTKAGVQLVRALAVVADSTANARLAEVIRSIGAELSAGVSLAAALASHPGHFNGIYRHLVAVGEQSGALDIMLERVAAHQERDQATRRKVRKALTYPAVVLVVATLVTGLLLIHIVPQFEAVFASADAELPVFTRFVIGCSEALRAWWPTLLAGGAGVVVGVAVLRRRSARWRQRLDRALHATPIVGGVLRKAAVGRMARTLATATAAGVPLVDALEAVAGASGHAPHMAALRSAGEQVAAGRTLAAGLGDSGAFPDMLVQLIAVGEESGSLDHMLAKCAEIFEAEVEDAVDNLTTLIEPALMGVLGVVVGGLIVAMYLPVFQLGSVFGG